MIGSFVRKIFVSFLYDLQAVSNRAESYDDLKAYLFLHMVPLLPQSLGQRLPDLLSHVHIRDS